MPKYTPHYHLGSFLGSDTYSASIDKDRFSIIDNQLSFISDVLEDGKINGWIVSDSSSGSDLKINISEGTGIINRVVTRTFFDLEVDIEDNTTSYIYMKKKAGVPSRYGPFSYIEDFLYNDTIPPTVPTGLSLSDVTSSSVVATWNTNPETDFYEYILQISTDNIVFEELDRTSSETYNSINLLDNTYYYYKIASVDTSGNISAYSSSVSVKTLQDFSTPPAPDYFIYLTGNSQIQIIWSEKNVQMIKNFVIEAQEVDANYNTLGSPVLYVLDNNTFEYVIEGLSNEKTYKVSINSLSYSDIPSEKIELMASPKFNNGPDEVTNITANYSKSVDNPIYNSLNIYWNQGEDPYASSPEKYSITIIENGYRVADAIESFADNLIIDTISYGGICEPVLSDIEYIVKIQAIDSDGNVNHGVITRVFTGLPNVPPSPSSIIISLLENNLVFSWKNGRSNFDHNILTIQDKNLDDLSITDIENGIDYGKSESYAINKTTLIPEHEYIITLQSADSYGQLSLEITSSFVYPELAYSLNTAPPVDIIYAFSGDNQILLIWEAVNRDYTEYYQIWRANFTRDTSYLSSDFALLQTVPSDILSFVDHEVVNGTQYIYFITTIDRFGNVSQNPVDDGYFYHPSASTTALSDDIGFGIPLLIDITNPSGNDLLISWSSSIDNFDGYEIYRSFSNKYSWTKVGSINRGQTSFLDSGALSMGSGYYYYIVRQVRNEGQILVSSSIVSAENSIILAKVVSSSGSLIITDLYRDLYKLKSDISDKLDLWIAGHLHNLAGDSDNRINLADNVIIYDWTTSDNRTFITTEPMVTFIFTGGAITGLIEATGYVVRIDDIVTDIPYIINPIKKQIIFSREVLSSSISVECLDLNETINIVSSDRVTSVSATQVESNRLAKETLPEIHHDGRVKEELMPLRFPMISKDGYEFEILQNTLPLYKTDIGKSITFYDIRSITSSIFIAATSNGIMISRDSGGDWAVLYPAEGVYKIHFATNRNKYIAISFGEAYISEDGLGWARLNGLENTSIIRDITDDTDNIYITTDIGVFAIKDDSYGNLLSCQQLPLYSGETTDTYAIWNDDYNSKIVISTEIGLFETINQGLTWSYTTEIDSDLPIWQFVEYGDYIFALCDKFIWRKYKNDTYFSKISYLSTKKARSIVIFEDRIIITTDEGVMISDISSDIYIDDKLEMKKEIYLVEDYKPKISPIFALRVINGVLYIGTDRKLFIGYKLHNINILYDQLGGKIPSVYIDNEDQIIGVYYSITNNKVFFDQKISNKKVSVVTQYKIFRAKNKGWLDQKYDANVEVYDKNILLYTLTNSIVPTSQFSSVVFDSFTEGNSNSKTALKYENEYLLILAELILITGGSPPIIHRSVQDVLSNLVYLYNKTYSQYIDEVKYASLITIDSNDYFIVDFEMVPVELAATYFKDIALIENIPSLEVSQNEVSDMVANASDGVFRSSIEYDKVLPLYIYIKGATLSDAGNFTEKEIEDKIELFDSGLTFSLSEISQGNLVKSGLFLDRTFNSEQTQSTLSPLYDSVYITPRDKLWYDTLNSTIDYNMEYEFLGRSIDADYVLCTLYVQEMSSVLLGTDNGLIGVDVTTMDMYTVDLEYYLEDGEFIKDIYRTNNIIYLATDKRIFISYNFGINWYLLESSGMPSGINKIIGFSNKLVLATNSGIYYKFSFDKHWVKSIALNNVKQMLQKNGIFSISENKLYYSSNGVNWSLRGNFGGNVVNNFNFLKTLAFFATNSGLQNDSGTIFGTQLGLSLVDLSENILTSGSLKINDIAVSPSENQYVAGTDDGYYFVWDSSDGLITKKTDSYLDVIHKIIYIDDNIYWMFGNGFLKSNVFPKPIKLSNGTPF